MNPITHGLVGWVVATLPRETSRRDRALVTLAGLVPDFDGFGAPVEILTRDTDTPLLWWTDYHHLLGHNLLAGTITAALAVAAANRRLRTAALAFLSFHLHLLGDIVGARGPDGYDWPIPYFAPFNREFELAWSGQWALNAWPNFVITGILLALTFRIAWKRGYSPVGLISERADSRFVQTLRNRFGTPPDATFAPGPERP